MYDTGPKTQAYGGSMSMKAQSHEAADMTTERCRRPAETVIM